MTGRQSRHNPYKWNRQTGALTLWGCACLGGGDWLIAGAMRCCVLKTHTSREAGPIRRPAAAGREHDLLGSRVWGRPSSRAGHTARHDADTQPSYTVHDERLRVGWSVWGGTGASTSLRLRGSETALSAALKPNVLVSTTRRQRRPTRASSVKVLRVNRVLRDDGLVPNVSVARFAGRDGIHSTRQYRYDPYSFTPPSCKG